MQVVLKTGFNIIEHINLISIYANNRLNCLQRSRSRGAMLK